MEVRGRPKKIRLNTFHFRRCAVIPGAKTREKYARIRQPRKSKSRPTPRGLHAKKYRGAIESPPAARRVGHARAEPIGRRAREREAVRRAAPGRRFTSSCRGGLLVIYARPGEASIRAAQVQGRGDITNVALRGPPESFRVSDADASGRGRPSGTSGGWRR